MHSSNKIKIHFVDFWSGADTNFLRSSKGFGSTVLQSLEKYFVLDFTDDNPDIVVYSVFGNQNNKYDSCKKILYTAEWTPKHVLDAQYSISFMPKTDSNFRLPNYERIHSFECYKLLDKSKIDMDDLIRTKKKFCLFIVSNGNCKVRNQFYKLLSEYKRIDSCGQFTRNVDFVVPDRDTEEYYKFISEYKFMITFENRSAPGYCTEKLYNGMRGLTIPIYWGDPNVCDIFNEESFIRCTSVMNFGETFRRVVELDNNDTLYRSMLNQPYVKDEFMSDKYVDKRKKEMDQYVLKISGVNSNSFTS